MTVKSIGTAGGRDYANIADWEAACPANLVTAADQWIGELYADSEFVVTATVNLSGVTTNASYYLVLRPASGQGFNDHPDKLTNALRYNAANGVAIRSSTGYIIPISIGSNYTRLLDLQIAQTVNRQALITDPAQNIMIERCILDGRGGDSGVATLNRAGSHAVNCLIITRQSFQNGRGVLLGSGTNTDQMGLVNCTVLAASDFTSTSGGIRRGYSDPETTNVAVFGFATCFDPRGSTFRGDYNASGDASAPGTVNYRNLTFTAQFENTLAASSDFRVKAGSDLIDAGTADARTGGLDILKQTRSATTPTIGAFEFITGGPEPSEIEGTGAGSLAALLGNASGSFYGSFTGFGAANVAPIAAASAGTFTPAVVTGTASADIAALSAVVSGTFTSLEITGAASAALEPILSFAAGTFYGSFTGTGVALADALTAGVTGSVAAAGSSTGLGSATLTTVSGTASGTFYGAYTGTAAAVLSPVTAAGSGDFIAAITGAASASIAALAVSADGWVTVTGIGTATFAALTGYGAGTFTRLSASVGRIEYAYAVHGTYTATAARSTRTATATPHIFTSTARH